KYVQSGGGTQTADAVQFTAQFMANLADYKDGRHKIDDFDPAAKTSDGALSEMQKQQRDNALTQYTYQYTDPNTNVKTTATAIGFEYLPMLSEVYTQAEYKSAASAWTGGGAPPAGDKNYKITWDRTTGKVGY